MKTTLAEQKKHWKADCYFPLSPQWNNGEMDKLTVPLYTVTITYDIFIMIYLSTFI